MSKKSENARISDINMVNTNILKGTLVNGDRSNIQISDFFHGLQWQTFFNKEFFLILKCKGKKSFQVS